jgi:hypothetical protein
MNTQEISIYLSQIQLETYYLEASQEKNNDFDSTLLDGLDNDELLLTSNNPIQTHYPIR